MSDKESNIVGEKSHTVDDWSAVLAMPMGSTALTTSISRDPNAFPSNVELNRVEHAYSLDYIEEPAPVESNQADKV